VEIFFDKGDAAAHVLSAVLPPLLEKAWGGRRPELIISGGRNQKPEKLDALRAAPDLQELQKLLPGEFIEFRPSRPAKKAAEEADLEGEAEDPPPGPDLDEE
jgi:hypothetical protein